MQASFRLWTVEQVGLPAEEQGLWSQARKEETYPPLVIPEL